MTDLIFKLEHALEAIRLAKAKGRKWLYRNYPKPGGQMRKSTTGFLMHGGAAYPVKPLGRLANEIAGVPMTANPITNVFRRRLENLGFHLIESPEAEAEEAVERQRRLAEVWERPGQAKFRRRVFALFGARCLVTGCETLLALEAAHVLPVSNGGCDEGWNGMPLRADLHRLFDADVIRLEPDTWTLIVSTAAGKEYAQYHDSNLTSTISKLESATVGRCTAGTTKSSKLTLPTARFCQCAAVPRRAARTIVRAVGPVALRAFGARAQAVRAGAPGPSRTGTPCGTRF